MSVSFFKLSLVVLELLAQKFRLRGLNLDRAHKFFFTYGELLTDFKIMHVETVKHGKFEVVRPRPKQVHQLCLNFR